MDPVAHDLSNRILSRDLFKQVPVSHEEIARYATEVGYLRLHDILSKYAAGNGKYYLVSDTRQFQMSSDDEADCGFFVDQDNAARRFADRAEFLVHRSNEGPRYRLFVVREALDDVASEIRSGNK